ncbi:PTS transporter subunit IIC, partial [Staphylococcus aureus]
HQQMFAVWVADKLAPKLGNPKKRLDDLKLPKWLSMLHDDIISTGLIMLIFFGGIMLVLGPNHFTSIKGGDIVSAYDPKKMWFGTYVISTTLSFAVYLTILKTGVRMFVSELTVSFQG